MDFKIVGTIIAVFMSLGLLFLLGSKFVKQEKSIDDIIESAQAGDPDYIRLSLDLDLDLCEYVGGKLGCDSELGIDPYCFLEKHTDYIIVATPTEAGVCLLVEEAMK